MRKLLYSLIVLAISVAIISCQKQNPEIVKLTKLVEEINATPDRELANGTILSKCEYNPTDSLFTYRIKVVDNRFDNYDADSVKVALAKEVQSPSMTKLVKVLVRNSISLQYVYSTSKTELTILFTPEELQESKVSN